MRWGPGERTCKTAHAHVEALANGLYPVPCTPTSRPPRPWPRRSAVQKLTEVSSAGADESAGERAEARTHERADTPTSHATSG